MYFTASGYRVSEHFIPVDKDRKSKKIISRFGLLNVENAVHKYEGEISAVKEEVVINVNIVLPIRKA